LGNYGGPTQTHALLVNSPAIDAGDDCVFSDPPSCIASSLTTDQRGAGHSRQLDGPDPDTIATVDIGSYELSSATTASIFVVNSTADTNDGSCDHPLGTGTGNHDCTLREAINAANASSDPNTINFNIPDSGGVQTIVPQTNLPAIVYPVTIDGYSQPGATPNTNTNTDPGGDNANILIELEGSGIDPSVPGIGLDIIGGGSTVKGLAINRFMIEGTGAAGIRLSGSGGNTITGNFIGTDAAGIANGNLVGVLIDDVPNNIIGGPITDSVSAAARNLISANSDDGVQIQGVNATGNKIQGNFIGTDLTSSALLGNSGDGVQLCQNSHNNLIGGTSAAFANVIANNGGNGVNLLASALLANTIRHNSIYNNGALGIDLGNNGVTDNDSLDHTGPNNYQNFPVSLTATASGGTGTILGTLNSTPDQNYTIDFYSNNAVANPAGCDGSGYGEGQTYLGSKTVTTSSGTVSFTSDPLLLNPGDSITATATDATGNTSEFSACITVTAPTNTNPTITAIAVTQPEGSPFTNAHIADVTDAESGAGGVTVTVDDGASSTVNFVTVSNIANDGAGKITADVVAACGSTTANFTLTATDGGLATATKMLTVTVSANTAPTLVYSSPQSVVFGGALNVSPTSASDNGTITGYAVQAGHGLTTAPTVDSSGVVSITNAQPAGAHTITIRATDNCGAFTDAAFTLNVGAMPTFAIDDVAHNEGNAGTTSYTFTVTKTGSTALSSSVNFATVDGSATTVNNDYQANTGTLTFLPTDTTKQITVLVNGDTTVESDEAFTVHLSGASSATISDADGTGTITNDDSAPTFAIDDVAHNEGNAGTTSYTFTVTKTGSTALSSSVNFATVDGSATTANNDYQLNTGALNFLATDTTKQITVLVNGDTTVEPDEAFTVHLSGASGATIGDADGTGTITNDDVAPPSPTPTPTPTASPIQLILDESGPAPDQVAALDAVLFLRDPFPVVNGAALLSLGLDRNTRVMIFVTNLQLAEVETSSAVVVNLIDSNGQVYDVTAEDVRPVLGFDFTQVIFRLPDNLPAGACTIRVKAHGQTSNSGTIRIRT
jgi:CSLREA domain-containing protein